MKQRPRYVKDKKVRVFRTAPRNVWGYERVFKTYIHPEDCGGLWAHVLHLRQRAEVNANQEQNNVVIQFIIAHSPKIAAGLFLEFDGKTYRA